MMRKPLSYSLKVSRSGSFLHPTLTASIHPCDTLEFMCTSSLIVYLLSVASGLEGARGSIGCLTYSLRFLKPAANKPLTIDPLTPPAGADRSAPPITWPAYTTLSGGPLLTRPPPTSCSAAGYWGEPSPWATDQKRRRRTGRREVSRRGDVNRCEKRAWNRWGHATALRLMCPHTEIEMQTGTHTHTHTHTRTHTQ